MDQLDDDTLIAIFKNLDVQSRLDASKTCQRWRRLLKLPDACMDDVSEVRLTQWFEDPWSPSRRDQNSLDREAEKQSLSAVLSYGIGRWNQLTMAGSPILYLTMEEILKEEPLHFEKINVYGFGREGLINCLAAVPSCVKHIGISGAEVKILLQHLPESFDLQTLYLNLDTDIGPLSPPPALKKIRLQWKCTGSLEKLKNCIGLEELTLNSVWFDDKNLARLLAFVRDECPNLATLNFEECRFYSTDLSVVNEEFGSPSIFPVLQSIKFSKCSMNWPEMLRLLLVAADVKMIHISLLPETSEEEKNCCGWQCVHDWYRQLPMPELRVVYELMPLIEKNGAELELRINRVDASRALEDIPVPLEMDKTLRKLGLSSLHHSRMVQSILMSGSCEKLVEINVDNCIEIGDEMLEAVAEWCSNLKKLVFTPHRRLGLNAVTKGCFTPFLKYWSGRKSAQLSIECTNSDVAFGGFDFPVGQEKGVFDDGKRCMLFRKKPILVRGAIQRGLRLVIWDGGDIEGKNRKMLVIRDYKLKSFDQRIQVRMNKGKCVVKKLVDDVDGES